MLARKIAMITCASRTTYLLTPTDMCFKRGRLDSDKNHFDGAAEGGEALEGAGVAFAVLLATTAAGFALAALVAAAAFSAACEAAVQTTHQLEISQ